MAGTSAAGKTGVKIRARSSREPVRRVRTDNRPHGGLEIGEDWRRHQIPWAGRPPEPLPLPRLGLRKTPVSAGERDYSRPAAARRAGAGSLLGNVVLPPSGARANRRASPRLTAAGPAGSCSSSRLHLGSGQWRRGRARLLFPARTAPPPLPRPPSAGWGGRL